MLNSLPVLIRVFPQYGEDPQNFYHMFITPEIITRVSYWLMKRRPGQDELNTLGTS